MLKRRSLLALSIALCLNAQAGTDIKQYNYDDTISNKDIGVDIAAVINCGYGYGEGTDCNSNTSSGYGKNSSVTNAAEEARTLNKGEAIQNSNATDKAMGINSMDSDPNYKYANTRDIEKQTNILNQTYGSTSTGQTSEELKGLGINGVTGTGVDYKNTDVSSQTATYNTNKLSNEAGEALRYKCLTPNPNRPAGTTPASDSYYLYNDVQCLSIRTVSLSNDSASAYDFSKSDPLRKSTSERSKQNYTANNSVINVNTSSGSASTANAQQYACGVAPERAEYSSNTCQSKPYGRQQICNQKLTVDCGTNAKGDRDLPECISGLVKDSFILEARSRAAPSFRATNSAVSFYESWRDGSSGSTSHYYITFMVNNPDKVKMKLTHISYDNRIDISLNNTLVAQASTGQSASQNLNIDLKDNIRLGINTFQVTLYNWAGPAAVGVTIAIDPTSYETCQCKESWVKTCTVENVELQ